VPFSVDQFFDVFALYNRAFGLVAVLLWFATAVLLALVWRSPRRFSAALTALLAVLWAWGALAYHAWAFSRINPVAWLFAALFLLQAAAFVHARRARSLDYFRASGAVARIGVGLAVYALAYPIVSVAFVHAYPATPTFGVPCPTAILTIGLLLTVAERPPALLLVPAVWGLIGGSAALFLSVPSDYVLLGAGAFSFVLIVHSRYASGRQRAHGRYPAATAVASSLRNTRKAT